MPRHVLVLGRTLSEHELACPDCGAPMSLRGDEHGVRYMCGKAGCRGAHGAHPDGSPHGVPADADTRRARAEAHEVFDRVWKLRAMSRSGAYAWMRESVGCGHISEMSKPRCRKLVEAVYARFPEMRLEVG